MKSSTLDPIGRIVHNASRVEIVRNFLATRSGTAPSCIAGAVPQVVAFAKEFAYFFASGRLVVQMSRCSSHWFLTFFQTTQYLPRSAIVPSFVFIV